MEKHVGYYVSVISSCGKQHRLALGPYRKHEQAEANADLVRNYVVENDPNGIWYSYGTCKVESEELQPGVLNERMYYDGAFFGPDGTSIEKF